MPNKFIALKQGWFVLALFILLMLQAIPTYAEGSIELFPDPPVAAGTERANLEWRTNAYGPGSFLTRRTLLNVYAEAGETILVGSSAVGVGAANILIYPDNQVNGQVGQETLGTPVFNCNTQRALAGSPADMGQINSRAEEVAGPDTIPNSVANAYEPCYYTVPPGQGGIYSVVFYGPAGNNSAVDGNPTSEYAIPSAANFNGTQGSSVAAWDVTVRDDITSPVSESGRLFSYYLAMFTGGNNDQVDMVVDVVTLDGYIYETDTAGFDPNGFVVFGNQKGFLDTDGNTPLYHDVLGATGGADMTTLQGGVTMQRPQFPIFFTDPDPAVLTALGIPIDPVPPFLSNAAFNGSITGNISLVAAGGQFSFDSNVDGLFELVISSDAGVAPGAANFDPTLPTNRVLRGDLAVGGNTVNWDGLDNDGMAFPVNDNYPVRITLRAGEYHFPMLDVENSLSGGPTYNLINPPGGICPAGFAAGCSTGFYDDRGYTTLSGVDVGVPGDPLCAGVGVVSNPINSDLLIGFNTNTNNRNFGDALDPWASNANVSCNGSLGDVKGLDLWTYYPSNTENVFVTIVDTIPPDDEGDGGLGFEIVLDLDDPLADDADAGENVALNLVDPFITKSVNPPFAFPGEAVTWTIQVTNPGSNPVGNVNISDTLPAEVEILSVTASAGSATFSGQVVTINAGTLNPGETVTVTVQTRVRNSVAVPFVIENLACMTSDANAAELCAAANVLSVASLPATGESPWSGVRSILIMSILAGGMAIIVRRRNEAPQR